jgi:hypothetical protein
MAFIPHGHRRLRAEPTVNYTRHFSGLGCPTSNSPSESLPRSYRAPKPAILPAPLICLAGCLVLSEPGIRPPARTMVDAGRRESYAAVLARTSAADGGIAIGWESDEDFGRDNDSDGYRLSGAEDAKSPQVQAVPPCLPAERRRCEDVPARGDGSAPCGGSACDTPAHRSSRGLRTPLPPRLRTWV